MGTCIDHRSIFKRNGDDTEGIRNVFKFIASLKKYLNAEHYLLYMKINETLKKWEYYDYDDVVLSQEECSTATNTLLEINHEFEQLKINYNKLNDFDLNDAISNLRDKYNQFMNKE